MVGQEFDGQSGENTEEEGEVAELEGIKLEPLKANTTSQ
jgi:hypothetical protein